MENYLVKKNREYMRRGENNHVTHKLIFSADLHFPVAGLFYFTNLLFLNVELVYVNVNCNDHSRR